MCVKFVKMERKKYIEEKKGTALGYTNDARLCIETVLMISGSDERKKKKINTNCVYRFSVLVSLYYPLSFISIFRKRKKKSDEKCALIFVYICVRCRCHRRCCRVFGLITSLGFLWLFRIFFCWIAAAACFFFLFSSRLFHFDSTILFELKARI